MKNITEEWKFYKAYKCGRVDEPNRFVEVSNLGRVRINGKIRIFNVDKDRYIKVCSERLHVVIARLFIPNPENKPMVDHIDTNKHNNRVDNLHWVTAKENANNPNTIKAYKKAAKQRFIDYPDSYKSRPYHKPWNKGLKNIKTSYKHSEETRKKISEKLKGRKSPAQGKKMSEETKAKISNSHKGRHWYVGEDGKRHY